MTHLEPSRRIYRMWNRGREVNDSWTDGLNLPDEIPQIGTVDRISYWSDKFARTCVDCGALTEEKKCPKCGARTEDAPGVFELYTHDCDSHAPVYAPSSSAGDSPMYLQVTKGRVPVTCLAYMAEIEMRTLSGKRVSQPFAFKPSANTPLYVMQDKKTLIIPWSRRAMIVTGSKMRVTEHGIIH